MEAALQRWFTDDYRISHPDFMETVRVWRRQVDAKSYAEATWVLATGVKELTVNKEDKRSSNCDHQ